MLHQQNVSRRIGSGLDLQSIGRFIKPFAFVERYNRRNR